MVRMPWVMIALGGAACGAAARPVVVENRAVAADPVAADRGAPTALITRRDEAPAPLPALPARPQMMAKPAPIATVAPAPPLDLTGAIASARQAAARAQGNDRVVHLARLAQLLGERADQAPDDAARRDDAIAAATAVIGAPGFDRYAQADAILFAAGVQLMAAHRPADARARLLELIKKYPASPRVPDAYVLFGDYAFEANDPATAGQFYAKAGAFPGAAVASYARYKLAWVQLNQGDPTGALDGFAAVALASEPRLARAAADDAVTAYAQIGRADQAWPFFDRIAHDRAPALVARLGAAYLDLGKDEAATVALETAQLHTTAAADICAAQVLIVRATLVRGRRDEVLSTAADLVQDLAGDGCRADADDLLGTIAWTWHAELPRSEADPAQIAEAWHLAIAATTTPARRAIAARDRALVVWAQASRTRVVSAWLDASAAARDAIARGPDDDLAGMIVDACDNALRTARTTGALDASLATIVRVELAAVPPGPARAPADALIAMLP
jgi:tetratricopeptide (TPR) repeat protein